MVREMEEDDLVKAQDDNLPDYVVTNIHGFILPPFDVSAFYSSHSYYYNELKIGR